MKSWIGKGGLFMGLAICSLIARSQNIETIAKEKPFKYSGTIQAEIGGYAAAGIPDRRNNFLYSLSGNPNFSFYGINVPFSFIISDQQKNFRQPFNQFGLSPYWKWITVHGGFRNLSYSNYTLAGHTFLGIGIDLTPKWFRFSAMYGRFQKAIAEDTTVTIANSLSQYNYPSYKRRGYAFKIGFGKNNNFVDLIFLKVKDDSTSIPYKPVKQMVLPGDNAVIGLNSTVTIIKKITLKFDGAVSALTKDLTSADYDLEDVPLRKLVGFLVNPKMSTTISYALETSVKYASKPFTIMARYQRVAPEYVSFGTYFIQSDLERISVSPGFVVAKNKLRVNGSFGWQRDNLFKQKLATTKRIIGSANIDYQASQKFGASLQYSNFGTSQSPGSKSLNDTNKIDQISHSVVFVPRLMLLKKENKLMHNIMLTSSFQILNDKNKLNSTNYEMKTLNNNLMYMFGHLPKKINTNIGFNTNYTITAPAKMLSFGFTAGLANTFAKDKMNSSVQYSWNKNYLNSSSNGYTMQANVTLTYMPVEHHAVSLNMNLTNNKSKDTTINPSFTEFLGMVRYTLTY
jgi:hypothetical protein